MTFQDLKLTPPILSALRDLGYEAPSPIQAGAIPPALAGRDVLGCAQTGTGKTCAFATPILQRLAASPVQGRRPIRALILTPTRELALQIGESFDAYGKNLPLRTAVIFGGVGQQPQVDKLSAGVDILVATPGRLLDLHDQGFIHVENLEIFVLDEADRMLDMGFIHDVKKIIAWLPKKKQTLFFSATMPPEVQGLVDSLLHNPAKVAVDPVSSPVEVIDQKLCYVDRANKSRLLAHFILTGGVKNALVFTRTKHGANKVAADLQKSGIPAAAIHGNKSQTARQQALADFKAGRIKALVATDIAARGLDIEELSHVFNYNLPDVPETYVHRIGRTGRAGRGGTAVTFCEYGEKELLAPIEKLLKKPIPVVEDHPWPMEVFEAPKRDKQGRIVNADDAEARQAARDRKKERDQAKKAKEAETRAKEGKPEPKPQPKAENARQPKQPAPQAKAKEANRPAPQPKPAKKAPEAPEKKAKAPQPQPDRSPAPPAQTSAAGKRQSGGYKPSRTLEEALNAMAPKSPLREEPTPRTLSSDPRRAEFERWMAEERAIRAKQAEYYRDPLAGDVIMDATARLLAPKGSLMKEPVRPQAREEVKTPAPKGKKKKNGGEPAKPQVKTESAKQPKAEKQPKQIKQPAPQQNRKSAPADQSGRKAPQPQGKKTPPAPAPKVKKEAASLEARRQAARSRRRGPMEPSLRLGSQKDSTEQHSLMKPYYFGPDED